MDAARLNPLIDIGISPQFVERFRVGSKTFNTQALHSALKRTVNAMNHHAHPDYNGEIKPTKDQQQEATRLNSLIAALKPDQLDSHIRDLIQRNPVTQNLQRVMEFATSLSQRLEASKNNFAEMVANIFTGEHALNKVNAKPARICVQTNPQPTEEAIGQPAVYDKGRKVFYHRDSDDSSRVIALDFRDIAIDAKGKVSTTKLKAPEIKSHKRAASGLKIPKGKPRQGTWIIDDEYETMSGANGKMTFGTEARASTLPIRIVGSVDLEAFYKANEDHEPVAGCIEFDADSADAQTSKFKFPYYSSFDLASAPEMLSQLTTDIKAGNYLVAVRDDVAADSAEAKEFFVLGKVKGYHATA